MANEKFFTKDELKAEIKASYGKYLEAARIYRQMRESYHAPAHKLDAHSKRSHSIGFTCYYHSTQKNNHFSKMELAQAWLDVVTVTCEMWDEIAAAAAEAIN